MSSVAVPTKDSNMYQGVSVAPEKESELVVVVADAVGEEEKDKDNSNDNDIENPQPNKSADETKNDTFFGRWLRKFGFNVEDNDYSDVKVPPMSYWQIFKVFFWFGCRAFGGMLLYYNFQFIL